MIHGQNALDVHPVAPVRSAVTAEGNSRNLRALRRPALPVMTSAILITALLTGCEDSESARRTTAQQQIDQAARELSLVRLSGSFQPETRDDGRPESREAARTSLEGIARRTSAINEGTAGQQEAASLIAAAAHFELGSLSAEDLAGLESVLLVERGALHLLADRSLRLKGLMEGLQAASDFDTHRAHLTTSREAAEADRRQFADRQRQLQLPIDERQQAIHRDREESARFIEEAGGLRREALLVGAMEGLPTWTEAIDLERRAGRIDREIADREVELDYEYRPEFRFASALADARREQIRAIDEAVDALGDARRSRQEVISSTEHVIRQFAGRMDSMLQALSAPAAEADALLAGAAEHLERAATHAQRAARGPGRDSVAARMLALRALKGAASLYAARAEAVSAHAALHQRIADADGTLGDAARAARAVRDETARSAELRAVAIDLLERARETAGQIPATADVDAIIARLDQSLTALDGRSRSAPARSAQTTPRTPTAPGSTATGGGADSPEALIAAMSAAAGDPTGIAMLDLLHARGAVGERLLGAQRRMAAAMQNLFTAMEEAFGSVDLDAFFGGPMGTAMSPTAGLENLAIIEQSDDRARATADVPMMGTVDLDLVRTSDGWKLDFLSLLGPLAQDPQMLGMMEQSGRAALGAVESVIAQVRDGTLTSAEAVGEALLGAMMQGG